MSSDFLMAPPPMPTNQQIRLGQTTSNEEDFATSVLKKEKSSQRESWWSRAEHSKGARGLASVAFVPTGATALGALEGDPALTNTLLASPMVYDDDPVSPSPSPGKDGKSPMAARSRGVRGVGVRSPTSKSISPSKGKPAKGHKPRDLAPINGHSDLQSSPSYEAPKSVSRSQMGGESGSVSSKLPKRLSSSVMPEDDLSPEGFKKIQSENSGMVHVDAHEARKKNLRHLHAPLPELITDEKLNHGRVSADLAWIPPGTLVGHYRPTYPQSITPQPVASFDRSLCKNLGVTYHGARSAMASARSMMLGGAPNHLHDKTPTPTVSSLEPSPLLHYTSDSPRSTASQGGGLNVMFGDKVTIGTSVAHPLPAFASPDPNNKSMSMDMKGRQSVMSDSSILPGDPNNVTMGPNNVTMGPMNEAEPFRVPDLSAQDPFTAKERAVVEYLTRFRSDPMGFVRRQMLIDTVTLPDLIPVPSPVLTHETSPPKAAVATSAGVTIETYSPRKNANGANETTASAVEGKTSEPNTPRSLAVTSRSTVSNAGGVLRDCSAGLPVFVKTLRQALSDAANDPKVATCLNPKTKYLKQPRNPHEVPQLPSSLPLAVAQMHLTLLANARRDLVDKMRVHCISQANNDTGEVADAAQPHRIPAYKNTKLLPQLAELLPPSVTAAIAAAASSPKKSNGKKAAAAPVVTDEEVFEIPEYWDARVSALIEALDGYMEAYQQRFKGEMTPYEPIVEKSAERTRQLAATHTGASPLIDGILSSASFANFPGIPPVFMHGSDENSLGSSVNSMGSNVSRAPSGTNLKVSAPASVAASAKGKRLGKRLSGTGSGTGVKTRRAVSMSIEEKEPVPVKVPDVLAADATTVSRVRKVTSLINLVEKKGGTDIDHRFTLPSAAYNRGLSLAAREIAAAVGGGKTRVPAVNILKRFGQVTGDMFECVVPGIKDPSEIVAEVVRASLAIASSSTVMLHQARVYVGAGWQRDTNAGAVTVVLVATGFQEISYIKKHNNLPVQELNRCMRKGFMTSEERLYDLNFIPEHYGIKAVSPTAHPVMCGAITELELECPPSVTLAATFQADIEQPSRACGTVFIDRVGRTAKIQAVLSEGTPTKLVIFAKHPTDLRYVRASTVLLRPMRSRWDQATATNTSYPREADGAFQLFGGLLKSPRRGDLVAGEDYTFCVKVSAGTKSAKLQGAHGSVSMSRSGKSHSVMVPQSSGIQSGVVAPGAGSAFGGSNGPQTHATLVMRGMFATYTRVLKPKAGVLTLWVDGLCVLEWTVKEREGR